MAVSPITGVIAKRNLDPPSDGVSYFILQLSRGGAVPRPKNKS